MHLTDATPLHAASCSLAPAPPPATASSSAAAAAAAAAAASAISLAVTTPFADDTSITDVIPAVAVNTVDTYPTAPSSSTSAPPVSCGEEPGPLSDIPPRTASPVPEIFPRTASADGDGTQLAAPSSPGAVAEEPAIASQIIPRISAVDSAVAPLAAPSSPRPAAEAPEPVSDTVPRATTVEASITRRARPSALAVVPSTLAAVPPPNAALPPPFAPSRWIWLATPITILLSLLHPVLLCAAAMWQLVRRLIGHVTSATAGRPGLWTASAAAARGEAQGGSGSAKRVRWEEEEVACGTEHTVVYLLLQSGRLSPRGLATLACLCRSFRHVRRSFRHACEDEMLWHLVCIVHWPSLNAPDLEARIRANGGYKRFCRLLHTPCGEVQQSIPAGHVDEFVSDVIFLVDVSYRGSPIFSRRISGAGDLEHLQQPDSSFVFRLPDINVGSVLVEGKPGLSRRALERAARELQVSCLALKGPLAGGGDRFAVLLRVATSQNSIIGGT
ncbi:unnamed protein product, partial [Closterium sp. Yama58-4]